MKFLHVDSRALCRVRSLAVRLVAVAVLTTTLSSCLKTRAQLRDDNGAGSEDDRAELSKPAPQPVQDVQPQGGYVIDELKSEINRLNGRIEELERQKQELGADKDQVPREDLKKAEARIVELEQAQANMLEAIKKLQENGAVTTAAGSSELYEKGREQYEAKNYDGAIETLTLYLKVPKAKRVQDATFLRGECYFALKQYKKAIIDYSKFPESFTKSSYMPQALNKIGLAFEALGMKEDAKGFYQELVEKHPNSPEAKRVRAKLKQ